MTDPASKRDASRDRLGSGTQRIRRHSERASINLVVVIELEVGRFEGTALDLGLGGMFVESDSVPIYGTCLDVLLTLPAIPGELRLRGVVRWTKQHGFGLQFLELGVRETYAIACLLESVKAKTPNA